MVGSDNVKVVTANIEELGKAIDEVTGKAKCTGREAEPALSRLLFVRQKACPAHGIIQILVQASKNRVLSI